jgi:TonB family protein
MASAIDLNPPAPVEVLPKIHRTERFTFPVRMLREGVKRGEARILLHVDPSGTLDDVLVVGYTNVSFAEESLHTVKKWKYEPARFQGESINAVVELSVSFAMDNVIAIERPVSSVAKEAFSNSDESYQATGPKKLDRIPVPNRFVEPAYPQELIAQGVTEKISVDFYIDETGQVRMPSITAGNHPFLRAVAITTVQQWHFEPPTSKGKPVLAHVEQVFDFSPPAKP